MAMQMAYFIKRRQYINCVNIDVERVSVVYKYSSCKVDNFLGELFETLLREPIGLFFNLWK